jgi:hypothetical protein
LARRRIAAAGAALLLALAPPAQAQAPVETVRLYPGTAPGSDDWRRPESATPTADGTVYANVRDPELLVYLPPARIANGRAVVILPGGGLRVLGIDRDMRATIARLNAAGIAAFILKYRVLQTERPPAPPPAPAAAPARWPDYPPLAIRNANANPASGDARLGEVLRFAVDDTRRAFALIRQNRARWRVDPAQIGMMGTSAGGGVAIGTLLARDPAARPSFIASIFGPALQDVTVATDAPPLFIVTETGHGPVTDGLDALFGLWRAARRPVEFHVFDIAPGQLGTHLWLDRFMDWMVEQGLRPADPRRR